MKYIVLSYCNYGSSDISDFDTLEQALECVARNTGEDSYCRLFKGEELVFQIKRTAELVLE